MPTQTPMANFKKIRIPAYISEPITALAEVVTTNNEMIQSLITIIDRYNNRDDENKVFNILRGKNIKKEIYHIDYDRYQDGSTPVILLRIKEKKKGFTDMSIESDETSEIHVDDKIATSQNCAVMYPNIDNIRGETSNNWIIFVYADPGKTDRDVITTVKMVLSQVFRLKINNVKPESANDIINREGLVPKLTAQYVIVRNMENEYLNVRGVRVNSTVKEIRTFEYQDVPAEDVETFVNTQYDREYNERKVTVSLQDQQQLKYLHKLNADQETIREAIEQSYNYETEILVSDLERMYDADFILQEVRGAARQLFGPSR